MEEIHITRAEQGEHWLVVTNVTTIKASAQDTSGNLLILEITVPPGGGPPVLHRHEYSEVFMFQEGKFEVSTVNEDFELSEFEVGTGDTVSIPSMAWHDFKNVGATPDRFIAVHSTPMMEDFMREIGRQIDDPLSPPEPGPPPSEEEMRRMMGIIGKYMEVLPSEKVRS
jgi:mannose-6-phosphate isomerase-like protein (cupin superfamily)